MPRAKARRGNPNWTKGGASPNPTGKRRTDATTPVATAFAGVVEHMDGWLNALTGLGIAGHDKSIATTFTVDTVSSEDALQMWRGDPVAARIVETIPNEALRQGYELCIGDDDVPEHYTPETPEPLQATAAQLGGSSKALPQVKAKSAKRDALTAYAKRHPSAFARRTRHAIARGRRDAGDAKPLQEAIEKKLKDLQLDAVLKECMDYERAYGGGAALIGANDFATDLRQPLDMKRVRSLDWLTPLEGRELIPLFYYNDPQKPKFGLPAIYQLIPYVIGAPIDGYSPRVSQIHESRLLVFRGIRVSRRIMSTGTLGWGDSIFTRVVRALRDFNVGHQSAGILLSDFAQAVYKIKGLADLISRNPNALTDSMMAVELGRSIARAVVIDSEEDFERKSTTLAGYPETLDRLCTNLAAAADMPLTLLMGQSPAGMNATGASDIRFFYDRVAGVQTAKVAPAILRIVEILLATMGEDPDTINHSVKFKALWQPTEKEIAESHLAQANADAVYLTNDVVSPEEMALSRFGGDQYSYETRLDFEARAAQEAVVAPTVEAKPAPENPLNIDPTALPDPTKVSPFTQKGAGKPAPMAGKVAE